MKTYEQGLYEGIKLAIKVIKNQGFSKFISFSDAQTYLIEDLEKRLTKLNNGQNPTLTERY